MTEAVAAPPAAPAEDSGFFGRLSDLFFSPSDAFRAIAARPMLGAALLAFMLLSAAYTAVWVPKVDPRQYAQAELEKSSRYTDASPEQQAGMLAMNTKVTGFVLWVFPLFGLLFVSFLALFYFLAFKAFGGAVSFKQSLAIIVWTALVTECIVAAPLRLLVMGLKGEWNLNPVDVLIMANASGLLDRNDVSKAVYALAGSVDLFSAWTVFLYTLGYAAATRRSPGSVAAVVVAVWVLGVLIKVGLVAIS